MKRLFLIYGHDSSLLDIRAALVRSAGFDVLCAYTRGRVEQLMKDVLVDALILCHTVPAEEDQDLVRKASTLQPQMKILILNANQPSEFAARDVATFDVGKGPKALMERLKGMVS